MTPRKRAARKTKGRNTKKTSMRKRAAKRPVKRRASKRASHKPRKRTAVVIRHVPFEDLGNFAPVLKRRGFAIRYIEAPTLRGRKLNPLAADLLIVLGGPIGAYDDEAYPFLRVEVELLKKRLSARRPVIGICLGAQLLARALGARVYPAPVKEMGWAPIELTPAGANSPLKHLAADKAHVLHWHGDTFDLPAGAAHLAWTSDCANQAFAIENYCLALQFHPEAPADIEAWLVGHTHEIATTPGVSVGKLRAQTVRCAPTLQTQGPRMFSAWLDGLRRGTHIKR